MIPLAPGLSFYAPHLAWLALPLVGGLVLLYFLKLKRPRLAVPSLVLWRQVVNDSRVNSPFQKFKRNILLWLQLAILLLLLLALMQPYVRGEADAGTRLPILIDRSASMAALDDSGRSRLELAKQQVRDIIEGLNPNEEVAIIGFARSAQQLAPFTSDKRVLLDALDDIDVEDTPSDIGDALRMADAMARSYVFERVLLISDGNFPPRVDFELPFQLDYQKLSPAGANMGITALNARRTRDGGWAVFVSVQATEDAQSGAALELIQDGEARGVQHISPIPGRAQRLVFNIKATQATSLELRLKPEGFDSLAGDNEAYLELAPPRPLFVFVSKDLGAYRSAVAAMGDEVRLFPTDTGATNSTYDLVITDNEDEPSGTSAQTVLGVGFIPQELAHLLDIVSQSSTIIDWRRTNQLLEYVELSDVLVLNLPSYRQVTRTTEQGERQDRATVQDIENEHYEVIAFGRDNEGREAPLMVQKREGERRLFNILFHTDRSTLPYRVGFPIMVQNAVRSAMFDAGLLEVAGDKTGVLPSLSVTAGRGYDVAGPGGFARDDEQPTEEGVLTGIPAPRAGQYVIRGGGLERRLGVSLLDAGETMLETADQIDFNELSVAATAEAAATNRSLWKYFVAAALVILFVEWWFFQRKPGGFSR